MKKIVYFCDICEKHIPDQKFNDGAIGLAGDPDRHRVDHLIASVHICDKCSGAIRAAITVAGENFSVV